MSGRTLVENGGMAKENGKGKTKKTNKENKNKSKTRIIYSHRKKEKN